MCAFSILARCGFVIVYEVCVAWSIRAHPRSLVGGIISGYFWPESCLDARPGMRVGSAPGLVDLHRSTMPV